MDTTFVMPDKCTQCDFFRCGMSHMADEGNLKLEIEHLCTGKRLDNNQWATGFYWTNGLGNHFIRETRDLDNNFILEDREICEKTICKSTGLVAADSYRFLGGETDLIIFEGDICGYTRCNDILSITHQSFGVVEKIRDKKSIHYGVYVLREYGGAIICLCDIFKKLDIIGNIHDNPNC